MDETARARLREHLGLRSTEALISNPVASKTSASLDEDSLNSKVLLTTDPEPRPSKINCGKKLRGRPPAEPLVVDNPIKAKAISYLNKEILDRRDWYNAAVAVKLLVDMGIAAKSIADYTLIARSNVVKLHASMRWPKPIWNAILNAVPLNFKRGLVDPFPPPILYILAEKKWSETHAKIGTDFPSLRKEVKMIAENGKGTKYLSRNRSVFSDKEYNDLREKLAESTGQIFRLKEKISELDNPSNDDEIRKSARENRILRTALATMEAKARGLGLDWSSKSQPLSADEDKLVREIEGLLSHRVSTDWGAITILPGELRGDCLYRLHQGLIAAKYSKTF